MASSAPQDSFTVLREISQHTDIKLTPVAAEVPKHAQGAALPHVVCGELHAALARHTTGTRPDP
ncbi:hypothetical protein AB0O67_18980 [Streptomyces sp. NPDC086077]|uniref:hypothetical protein n=1 Tax=Streptomyces sp. NPDC086077 TaxID=3154862 RepID=UPI00342D67DD